MKNAIGLTVTDMYELSLDSCAHAFLDDQAVEALQQRFMQLTNVIIEKYAATGLIRAFSNKSDRDREEETKDISHLALY